MIYNGDQWELQYIKNLPGADLLPWDDETAYHAFPKWNWVYDKFLLSKHTGVTTWDLGQDAPSLFPVFCKPRFNFDGLSKGAYIASSIDEIEDFDGYIAQEHILGMQYTTDYVLSKGKVIDQFTFMTHTNNYGEIKCFSSTPFTDSNVTKKVEEILKDYTGVCNVESINGKVIELHLRPSLQFADICGGFIAKLPRFIETGRTTATKFEQTYSRVFRTRHDGVPEVLKLPSPPPEVRSVQLAWEEGCKLSESDPSLFRKRYLIINGTDLQKIEEFSKLIKIRIL